MSAKVISFSLPESLAWKLDELHNRTGIPKSRLVQQGILLLCEGFNTYTPKVPDITLEDIEKEYAGRE